MSTYKGFTLLTFLLLQDLLPSTLLLFVYIVSVVLSLVKRRAPSYTAIFLKNPQRRTHIFLDSAAIVFHFTGSLREKKKVSQ